MCSVVANIQRCLEDIRSYNMFVKSLPDEVLFYDSNNAEHEGMLEQVPDNQQMDIPFSISFLISTH